MLTFETSQARHMATRLHVGPITMANPLQLPNVFATPLNLDVLTRPQL